MRKPVGRELCYSKGKSKSIGRILFPLDHTLATLNEIMQCWPSEQLPKVCRIEFLVSMLSSLNNMLLSLVSNLLWQNTYSPSPSILQVPTASCLACASLESVGAVRENLYLVANLVGSCL